jgi:hypothetical protein
MSQLYQRSELGDFCSVVCFKALMNGVIETIGSKAATVTLISAGRQYGRSLSETLHLEDFRHDLGGLATSLNEALGSNGTRLCIVHAIAADGASYRVYTTETICSTNEPLDSASECSFTLGTIWGAIELALGQRFRGKQVESVLRGSTYDTFEFTPL